MRRLIDLFRGKSPSPKHQYDMRTEMVYSYELNLLRVAAFNKGEREEAIKKLRAFSAWRLANGK